MPWPWDTIRKAVHDLPNPITAVKEAVSGVHPIEAITGHQKTRPPEPPDDHPHPNPDLHRPLPDRPDADFAGPDKNKGIDAFDHK